MSTLADDKVGSSREAEPDAPSRSDPLVAAASRAIGGPHGEHAVDPPRRAFWIPVRVVLLAALIMFAAAWVQKSPCASGGWQDHNQYTQFCYTDVVALYGVEGLSEGKVPYRDHPVEYPVLTGWFMGALGLTAYNIGQHVDINDVALFYHLNAIALSAFGLAAVAALLAMRGRRPWDAMMLAIAPIVLFTSTVNWDLFAVGLTMMFMLAWARGRLIAAGVLLGLAVAAKFYPLLLAGPMLVLGIRHRRLAEPLVTIGTAAVVWSAINVPVALAWKDSWLRFFELNSERGIDWGTSWYVLRHFTPAEDGSVHWLNENVNMTYLVTFTLCCMAIAALALTAPTPPRFAALAFLVVAAFLLTGKVWSQQYVLWLVPLAVLARPRWRIFLVWQIGELTYFFAFYGQMLRVDEAQGIPEWMFVAAALTRMTGLAVLCAFVVRDILHPERDVVRTSYGGGDPDAGYLRPMLKPAAI